MWKSEESNFGGKQADMGLVGLGNVSNRQLAVGSWHTIMMPYMLHTQFGSSVILGEPNAVCVTCKLII